MPLPTHLKPLPINHEQESHHPRDSQAHPLSSNPTSPIHQVHQPHRHTRFEQLQYEQYQHQHPRDGYHPHSPRLHEHKSHETDPMLPSHVDHQHHRHSNDNQNHRYSNVQYSHSAGGNLEHHQEHPHSQHPATNQESLPPLPPKSPRSPKSPTPLSKRLLFALTNKPTLSKTWEKRSYADQQKSAPLNGQMSPGRSEFGMDLQDYSSPRSRPMSFYASPAEIAAFKPLPLVDGHYLHDNVPNHAHSAPNLPVPPTRV